MNTEVKILLKKGFVFLIPIFVWMLIVIIVDPFNYFNKFNVISENSKEKSSQKLNSLLYNTIKYKNNPTSNIIIGDSRVRILPVDRIKEITGDDYFILYSNAAKLNEMIDLFWFAEDTTCIDKRLQNVIIALHFNLYNTYAYADRIQDVQKIISNPLIYIFNRNIVQTTYLSIKHELNMVAEKTKRNKTLFWKKSLDEKAFNQYAKYIYPVGVLKQLQEIKYYCDDNNINLTFVIMPTHLDYQKRVKDFNLIEEEVTFKNDIASLGEVIDFEFENVITENRNSFKDPTHTTDSVSSIIVDEIFSDSLVIGRKLQH